MKAAAIFKVPIAVTDDNVLVRPEKATKGNQYFCPNCRSPLILRCGTKKRSHFAHKASSYCSAETVIHRTAKYLVAQVIADWKAERGCSPKVNRTCEYCRRKYVLPLPDKVDSAAIEYRLPNGRIADVALMQGDTPVAVVEIFVKHLVEEDKAADLTLPWVELFGDQIVSDPIDWHPKRDEFRGKHKPCEACQMDYQEFMAECANLASSLNVALPERFYRFAPYKCYRCHKDMLVYTWPGRELWNSLLPPHMEKPIPSSIRLERSRTIQREYWGNVCPFCGSLQGDWYVYSEPDSPLCGDLELNNNPQSFETDLYHISARYFAWRRLDEPSLDQDHLLHSTQ